MRPALLASEPLLSGAIRRICRALHDLLAYYRLLVTEKLAAGPARRAEPGAVAVTVSVGPLPPAVALKEMALSMAATSPQLTTALIA